MRFYRNCYENFKMNAFILKMNVKAMILSFVANTNSNSAGQPRGLSSVI